MLGGDGSMLGEDGATNLETMHYYQKMYGDAYVDLCERGLARMSAESGGGTLIPASPRLAAPSNTMPTWVTTCPAPESA